MAKELWWEKYRRRQSSRVSFELILRKSVADTAREYIRQCCIAGVKEIREPNIDIKQRLTYAGIFMAMIVALGHVLLLTKSQTFASPLVVSLESSTYPISDIDFPAVALCNINRISNKALQEYAAALHANHTTYRRKKQEWSLAYAIDYARQYGNLIDFSFTENMKIFPNGVEEFETPSASHRIVQVMKRLAPNCDEMLIKCVWAGKPIECKDIFTVRRTVRGHCCVFNYILDYESAGRPNQTIAEVKRQTEKGLIHGLHVLLDPMIGDYAYPISVTEGFEAFLFDPTHFADPSGGRVLHRLIGPNEAAYMELQSVKQEATPEVRYYPQSTRKCLFHNELQMSFGEMYSYSACIARCRIRTVRTLCKCTPYFLPTGVDDGPVCTLERLRCLNKYKEKLLYLYPYGAETWEGLEMEVEDSLNCPECLPDCEFTQHFSKAFKMPVSLAMSALSKFALKEYKLTLLAGIDLTNKSILSIYQSTGDGILNRLDVISYWFEILSNVGGYAGILLGFSIISVVEIVYFFLFRFPYLLFTNYKKYY